VEILELALAVVGLVF